MNFGIMENTTLENKPNTTKSNICYKDDCETICVSTSNIARKNKGDINLCESCIHGELCIWAESLKDTVYFLCNSEDLPSEKHPFMLALDCELFVPREKKNFR